MDVEHWNGAPLESTICKRALAGNERLSVGLLSCPTHTSIGVRTKRHGTGILPLP